MLLKLKEQAEVIITISANDLESNKTRSDIGITYDLEVLRLKDAFTQIGLYVSSVVITQYANQIAADLFRNKLSTLGIKTYLHYNIDGYPSNTQIGLYVSSVVITQYANQIAADLFRNKLSTLGIKTYLHYNIDGYPSNIEKIVSENGYGKNDYIETTRPLVVITAPGPGSGKMATCLSQLYHEHLRGVKAGYAKFETFPIWNLPLKHPVNLAYEAATADLNDVNMIDPFHLEAYGQTTVNYNRDVEVFPVLSAIFEKILGECPYKSPTDMGVNMAGNCIIDDEVCKEASNQEIIRRYLQCLVDIKQGNSTADTYSSLFAMFSGYKTRQ